MRNLIILTIVVSSSMLAATAAAQTQSQSQSQSPRCKSFDQSLPECQTIGVSDAATGGAVNLLGKDYSIVPIQQTAASVFPTHLVIGAADLNNAQIITLLQRSYGVGKTVAIVGASQEELNRFHRLLRPGETANCQLENGWPISAALYGLQRSRNRYPPQSSSYCLINLDPKRAVGDRRWLRERFGLTPPQPAAGKSTSTGKFALSVKAATSDDPNQFLTGLTGATHCSTRESNNYGTIEADPYVYAMRNFTDTGCSTCSHPGADYYLVQDNLTFQKGASQVDAFGAIAGQLFDTTDNVQITPGSYNLEFADPATTTTFESSYTNGSSVTASGSVGVSGDGPNVTIGGSTTSSMEQTYSVPSTTILNTSVLSSAIPEWLFTPQSLPNGADFAVNPTWTWFIPRDSYPGGGTGSGSVKFSNAAVLFQEPNNFLLLELDQACSVPFPFSAWTVDPVSIQGLTWASPGMTGSAGDQFYITGANIYSLSVVAVLIDGAAVGSTNFSVVTQSSPTTPPPPYILVTLPANLTSGSHVIQVNTQFNNQNVFSTNPDNLQLVVP